MSTAVVLALAFMSSIWSSQQQQSAALRPSMNSLVHEDYAVPITPAMRAFFGGGNRTAPPASHNSTIPKWRLPAPELQQKDNGARTIVLVASVVCGSVGIGLLITAVMSYARHIRKTGRPEAQLGAV